MRRLKLWVALTIIAGGFAVSAVAGVGPRGNHRARHGGVRRVTDGRAVRADVRRRRRAVPTSGRDVTGGVGGDPRLNGLGLLTLTTYVNTTTGNGTASGRSSSPTGRPSKSGGGVVQGVVTGLDLKGVMTGIVRDRSNQAGGRLTANFQGNHNGTSFYVGIGFPATKRTRL